MKIGVVGATGYIGRHLTRAASAVGVAITPITSTAGAFDTATGMLSASALPEVALDAVIYLSQSPHYRDVPRQAAHLWAVNVVSALTAAEWAHRCGAPRFIYASTGNVYQPSFAPLVEDHPSRRDNWYALSKVHAEEALSLHRGALDVTSVRLFGVYGPHQSGKLVPNLIDSVREQRTIRLQQHPSDPSDGGGARLSLAYVDDIVELLLELAASRGPQVLNVAGPDTCSIREIATRVGIRLGIDPVFSSSAPPRDGDLVADRTKLLALSAVRFRAFDEGLDLVLGSA